MAEIVIAGGGTGGHVFPGLAVAAELRRAGVDVAWLGARRGLEAERVPRTGIPLLALPVTGAAGRSLADQLGSALRMPPAVFRAAHFLLRRNAAAVLAVGGYAAVPGAVAAAALGIPLVIQEQNALPGTANRLLAPWATAIACGFPSAKAAFPSLPAIVTGNPVRAEFFSVPPPSGEPSVLVLGGSQGSAFLNRTLPEAFAALPLADRPRIVHQSGIRWADGVRERYHAAGVAADVVGFIERPHEAFASAHLVVARAGALTVCELAAARRAVLLIPFAAAARDHQTLNAEALAATGAAEVLSEPRATPVVLASLLGDLLSDPARLTARGALGSALVSPTAAHDIAALVLQRAGLSASAEHGSFGGASAPPHALRDKATPMVGLTARAAATATPVALQGAERT